MSQRWQERSPTVRRPARADEADEIDVGHSSRVPARAHYIPLAQREPTAPPQAAFVVDQRGLGGSNRQPVSRVARRLSPSQPPPPCYTQMRPARAAMRKTQDDSQYQPLRPAKPGQTWDEEQLPTQVRPRPRMHWVFFVGVGMLIAVLLWYLGTALISWGRIYEDDLHYGRPRTFQTDAVVGHHDSADHPSHFLALNLNRQVEIIEFPGGDATKARIYIGPPLIGPGEDLAVVTLSFRDVNGDGKPDMLVTVAGSQVVFINDQGQFRPLRSGEQVTV